MHEHMQFSRFLLASMGLFLMAAARPSASLSVQVADAGPFATQSAVPAPKTVPARPTAGFEAAPVPNESLEAPAGTAAAAAPQLSPALLSQKAIFAGNAFSSTSSQEQALLDRDRPAAGISLSVPVR